MDYFLVFRAFILFPVLDVSSLLLNSRLPTSNVNFPHLNVGRIKSICISRDEICKSNDTLLCAVRNDERREYKDFVNSCYLFLENMCDTPDNEYYIVSDGTCAEYLDARRNSYKSENETASSDKENQNFTQKFNNRTDKLDYVTKAPLRAQEATFSTLYEVDTAFDLHLCPYSCPDTYSPVCLNVNRNYGKYLKIYTFINHCSGDLYYCKHWEAIGEDNNFHQTDEAALKTDNANVGIPVTVLVEPFACDEGLEFSPPPGVDSEKVTSSALSWSFCASSRYLLFTRFSESSSSLGHYGWLSGNYRYKHIMAPQERVPGFGK